MAHEERVLAVDLGGTHMRVAVVEASGKVVDRREDGTPQTDAHPTALVALMRSALSQPSGSGVRRAVVGTPGPVDYRAGRLDWGPHLPAGWLVDLTEERLEAAVGVPVALANDADLACVGEAYFGAGKVFADVAYVTISTGIGAGVVTGGRLVHGRRSLAEIGHTVIDRVAFEADQPATFELLASGTALARLAGEAGITGGGAEVERLAAAGDARAVAIWDRVVTAIGIGLGNVVEVFSPEAIVVGGGVGLSTESLLEAVRTHLAGHRPPGLREPVAVVRAALGDDAGLAGAAGWAEAFDPKAASRES